MTSSLTPQGTAQCHTSGEPSPPGDLVIGGGEGGEGFGVGRQIRASMLSPFVSQRLGTFIAKQNRGTLLVLKELVEAGKVTPVVGGTYPLSQVSDAIRRLGGGTVEARSSSRSEVR